MFNWVEAVRPGPSERQPRLTADLAHPKMFGAYPIAFQLQAIGDLAQRQAFVELQCCGGSVGYPVRLLIKRKGDMTFENLVKRLRCRRCGRSKPAPVYLVAGHHRTEQFGPDADGLSSSSAATGEAVIILPTLAKATLSEKRPRSDKGVSSGDSTERAGRSARSSIIAPHKHKEFVISLEDRLSAIVTQLAKQGTHRRSRRFDAQTVAFYGVMAARLVVSFREGRGGLQFWARLPH